MWLTDEILVVLLPDRQVNSFGKRIVGKFVLGDFLSYNFIKWNVLKTIILQFFRNFSKNVYFQKYHENLTPNKTWAFAAGIMRVRVPIVGPFRIGNLSECKLLDVLQRTGKNWGKRDGRNQRYCYKSWRHGFCSKLGLETCWNLWNW